MAKQTNGKPGRPKKQTPAKKADPKPAQAKENPSDALKNENAKLKAENKGLQQKLDNANKKSKDLENTNGRLKDRVDNCIADKAELSKQASNTKEQLYQLKSDVEAYIGLGFFKRVWIAASKSRLRNTL